MQESVGDCVRVSTHLVGSVCVDITLKMRRGSIPAVNLDRMFFTETGGGL